MIDERKQEIKKKQTQFAIFFIFSFVVLISRLFYLQIYEREHYLRASEDNRIREIIIKPVRGLIFDRNGNLLVDNHPAYDVFVIPYEILRNDSALQLTAHILSENKEELKERIIKKRQGLFSPVRVKSFVDFEILSQIEEHKLDLPGVNIRVEPRRFYPDSINASHLLGYIGEITDGELKQGIYRDVRMGDFVGKRGIEKHYDQLLRGKAGRKYIEVDALGREVRSLAQESEREPEPGKNLYLSLDLRLQQLLTQKMNGKRGVAIVADCETGEILAMVSKPDYPLQIFSQPIAPEVWLKIVSDHQKPLFHRAIQSLYPPGSTFKLILAATAMEKGINPFTKKFSCFGAFQLGRKSFGCWKPEGHGELNLMEAIEQSCNVYFYQLGLEIDVDDWEEISRKLLVEKLTGIDLPGENVSIVPDRNFLNKKYGKNRWTRGIILNQVIGQGDVLVTPIQMLQLVMIIANKGKFYPLHLLRYFEDPITKEKHWNIVQERKVNAISQRTFELLRQAMWRAVNGENGTAKSARVWGVEIAGKTGTAENPHGEPHAWFIGFAPYDNPKIAMCILIENGGSGGRVAAPIARDIVKFIFSAGSKYAE